MDHINIVHLLSQSFYTQTEFNGLLRKYAEELGLDAIYVELDKRHEQISTLSHYEYGWKLLCQSPKSTKTSYEADSSFIIRYSIWANRNVSTEIESEVHNIIKSYLGIDNINRSTKLPCYENQQENRWLLPKLEETLKRFRSMGKCVAIFMMDLDHFRNVNNQNSHEIGGGVLFEFGNILTKCCEKNAIVIHRSGDEFFVIMPYDDFVEPLILAHYIRERAKSYKYQNVAQPIDLTVAQGICFVTDSETSFDTAIQLAEKAYMPDEQHKHRDSVRIVCSSAEELMPMALDLDLAYIAVRSNLTKCSIFHNPYLDFISFMMSHCKNKENINSNVKQWIGWLKPDMISGMYLLNLVEDSTFKCAWSNEEFAFALFHGMCRNPMSQGKTVCLAFSPSVDGSFHILINNEVIYTHGENIETAKRNKYEIVLPNCDIEACEVRNTILMHIGYDPLIIPNYFYRIIRIDARPFTGGNLPDFWAGALSELIDCVSENQFINQLIVYGSRENAKRLCEYIDNIEHWNETKWMLSIIKQTKQLQMSIENCKQRLTGHILFVNEKNTLVQGLKRIYSVSSLDRKVPSNSTHDKHIFLERNLSYEPIRLDIEDGCTINTMEEAFPTVLEIIRKNGSGETMVDQAGRDLKELTNFKLTITNPSSASIPEYYSEQGSDLESYYNSVFGSSCGFFQAHLEENNQYQTVLRHIIDLIDGTTLKYATRRALLVIPHKIKDSDDISPLGLVSVYISPRQFNDRIVFNFSFTWRTVEAVVGFPYSLYGSIRYAERILDDIKNSLDDSLAPMLKMGRVTYFAYNLHMFLDPPYMRIVRGIINDATK